MINSLKNSYESSICSVGIDAVDIERFIDWCNFSRKQLRRIFTDQEIDYCLVVPVLSAQRFAVRFAVREAFYKALCAAEPDCTVSFLTVCRLVSVIHSKRKAPRLIVDWRALNYPEKDVYISLTHTKKVATAVVIFASKN